MKKKARHTATVSLGVMAAGFAGTFGIAHAPFGFVLQSGFEAGLVGGLADWFAVTALFRHPLGIPIPHTALLPKNRAKVTDALVNAIQTNLLHKESIIAKMKDVRIADRLANAAKRYLEAEDAGERTAKLLSGALDAVPRDALAAALAGAAKDALRGIDAGAALQRLGRGAVERGYEQPLLDALLDIGERFAASPEMRQRMGAAALGSLNNLQFGGFMGFAVNAFAGFMNEDKLGGMLQEFLLTLLNDMRRPGDAHRTAALDALRGALEELGRNERAAAEAERWKERFLEGEETDRVVAALLERAFEAVRRRAADPAYCANRIVPLAREALERLASPERVDAAEAWISAQAAQFVENNHGVIGQLVKENADKLDDKTLIAMMEEHVGKDLQWIRVNGAVCGFAIGIVLGLVQWFATGA
ncbi:DUF445 domain-containing protein [Paenibacillus sp.]|uniref:DUF445 domain-containing protein n=1 Tax=Paenibacillus sp. TaxID=58172 RepID=UPI002D3325C6|nr:DUF445 domain-containing protein [Paenibacillus sp.]HZG87649.1 DUF445 domain-containing protein [Paenibacillus sp.]